jgi:hypothetical protein
MAWLCSDGTGNVACAGPCWRDLPSAKPQWHRLRLFTVAHCSRANWHCSYDRHRCDVQLQGRTCALRAAANEKIQALTMTNNTLTASLKKQNQDINDLQTEAKRRE